MRDTDRFRNGERWTFAGVDFRLRMGRKAWDDHVIEWRGVDGWHPVVLDAIFLVVDFVAWNEDNLYPYPARGGEEVLRYLRVARAQGWRRATAMLHEARARHDEGEAY